MGVIHVSFLGRFAVLASSFVTSDSLTTWFLETVQTFWVTRAIEKWLDGTNSHDIPIDGWYPENLAGFRVDPYSSERHS